jgi:hypothetical protein
VQDNPIEYEAAQRKILTIMVTCKFKPVETRKKFMGVPERSKSGLVMSDYSLSERVEVYG